VILINTCVFGNAALTTDCSAGLRWAGWHRGSGQRASPATPRATSHTE